MRQDVVALFSGLAFIIFLLGMMWLWGDLQGWHANSGYSHNYTNTSQNRLLSEPYGCNDESIPGRSGPGCEATWYYWKIPPSEITPATRAVVWLSYSLHQIFVWGLIYRAQLTVVRNNYEGNEKKYKTDLRWFNWAMLVVNALFHVLHLVQTHWTYAATAQDVTMSSSQASVVMMVCFIFLMEYKERGLMFMWPNPESDGAIANKLRFHPGPITLIRKYHGFAFAWACIYTFWYHPMENTWGHTFGFFHTAIVLLQGSLAFTDIHKNRYWRLLNECWVFFHSTVIAWQTGDPSLKGKSDLWPIFTFGFGFLFAFTQIYAFTFWRKIPAWTRILSPLIYLGGVAALCGTVVAPREEGKTGFSRMYEMIFIPSQIYLQVLASWLFIFIFIVIESKFQSPHLKDGENSTRDAEKKFPTSSPTKQALYLCGIMVIYTLFIVASYLYEQAHYSISLTTSMIFFTFVFSTGICVTVMFFKQLIGPFYPLYVSKPNKIQNSVGENEHENEAYTAEKL